MSEIEVVFLTGFSGCGKTTIAPLLARQLQRKSFDTDSMVEKIAGMSVSDVFARKGEAGFRALESKAIRQIADGNTRVVVALGGGALMSAANRRLVLEIGTLVYLSCSIRELERRLRLTRDRPLLNREHSSVKARRMLIKERLETRLPGYSKADLRISTTNRTPHETVRELVKRIRKTHD